jgi:hypothetical protein
MHRSPVSLLIIVLAACAPAVADTRQGGFAVDVLVDGRPLPEYAARGTRYIEAIKDKEYAVRLRNPLGVRVAVALSVDGLNSIDARHTTATAARKWVLEPYESVTISGWQTGLSHARRFYFTSEERSYAQWIGRSQDVGVITAVFFRERRSRAVPIAEPDANQATGAPRRGAADARSVPPAPPAAARQSEKVEEYAATGIGRETAHPVQVVDLDLEDHPVASISLRYEYRPQLVTLGVLPPADPDRLTRRQRARGFDQGFCPVPER